LIVARGSCQSSGCTKMRLALKCSGLPEYLHGIARRGTIQGLLVARPARVTQNIVEEEFFAGVA